MSRRVLIVDFDSQRLRSTRSLLEGHELELHTAETLAQLEQALDSIDPEVCVVEPNLQGSDGFEICKAIRRSSVSARILAASSDLHGEATRSRARQAGVDHFFERPAGDSALVDAVVRSSDAGRGKPDTPRKQVTAASRPATPKPVTEDGPIELADLADEAFDGWLDRAFAELEGEEPAPEPQPQPQPRRAMPSPQKPATPSPGAPSPVSATPEAGPALTPESKPRAKLEPKPVPVAQSKPPTKLETKPVPTPEKKPERVVVSTPPPADRSISSEQAQQQVTRLARELSQASAPQTTAVPPATVPAATVVTAPHAATERGNGRLFAVGGVVVLLAGAAAAFVALRGPGDPISSELPVPETATLVNTVPAPPEPHDGIFLFEDPSAPAGDSGYVTAPDSPSADKRPAAAAIVGAVVSPPTEATADPLPASPKTRPAATKTSPASLPPATREPIVETPPVEESDPATPPATGLTDATVVGPATDTATVEPEGTAVESDPVGSADHDAQPLLPVAESVPPAPIQMETVDGTFDVAPVLIPSSRVQPRYPMAAARMGIEGVVVLQAMILSDGRVGEIEIVVDPAPKAGLGRAAVKAVQKWRYEPAIRAGRPVDAPLTIQIAFRH